MTHHLLKIITTGLPASAGINGAPLLSDPGGLGLSGTMPANPWLKPKENTLSISLGKPPARPGTKQPAIDVHAEVYTVDGDSQTKEPEAFLARFQRLPGDPIPLPFQCEIPFAIMAPPPTKLWAEAARVRELSPLDKQQLRTLIQNFADALQGRNLDAISALLDYKTRDCALANGQDPDRMRQVIRDLFSKGMFTVGSFRVEGAQANELNFRLIAGGQVVWLFQTLVKPALVVLSLSKRFTLTVFAAKIGGAWRIVR